MIKIACNLIGFFTTIFTVLHMSQPSHAQTNTIDTCLNPDTTKTTDIHGTHCGCSSCANVTQDTGQ